jgi:hypothetical protein
MDDELKTRLKYMDSRISDRLRDMENNLMDIVAGLVEQLKIVEKRVGALEKKEK